MLKFLSRVKIEFNALDPRTASCMEFLAQCNARKAKESNPACQVLVKRRTDDEPPKIAVTFVNGVEEVFDATSTPAQSIRTMILQKGESLETEQMFREAGEPWPVIIPEEELHQPAPGTKFSENVTSQCKLKTRIREVNETQPSYPKVYGAFHSKIGIAKLNSCLFMFEEFSFGENRKYA
ncbi:hypothetical protein L484_010012 [Morus notabilis]|uniref:Large ribosomal subunit protein mL53 n=1 Tax=Morus notabilis TaxID=981085 RepID=W9QFR6_9ROSA|nr:hypothetical protein L484_010012 [Morus notabilis]